MESTQQFLSNMSAQTLARIKLALLRELGEMRYKADMPQQEADELEARWGAHWGMQRTVEGLLAESLDELPRMAAEASNQWSPWLLAQAAVGYANSEGDKVELMKWRYSRYSNGYVPFGCN